MFPFPFVILGDGYLTRNVTITTTGVTDSTVRVVLTTGNFNYSKCRSDGGDIRFVANANHHPETQALSYWTEVWNNTGTSVLWVKIPSSGTSTIYMKYGNSALTSLSNIDNAMQAGLNFRLYNSVDLASNFVGGGNDTNINYSWADGVAISISGVTGNENNVSAQWVGWIKPEGSGNHIIYTTTDDGVRLYVDNTSLDTATIRIDQWIGQAPTEYSYTVTSWTDGLPKIVRFQWYEGEVSAQASLGWDGPVGAKVYPIPSTYLRSPKYDPNYAHTLAFSHTGTVGSEY